MSSTFIYCPVCGRNIRFQLKCKECGYEEGRDYEAFPTLSIIPQNDISVSMKHRNWDNKRIEEAIQLLVYPRIQEMLGQEQKYQHLENQITELTSRMEDLNNPLKTLFGESELKAGDIVTFGHYEQGKGIEPINWRVLEASNNKILLITEKAIDCKPFHNQKTYVNWGSSTLRKWLNGPFMKSAFSPEEKKWIMKHDVSADKNPKYNSNSGKTTSDCVFLLSAKEVVEYFPTVMDKGCEPTVFAKKQGANEGSGTKNCKWWLRSPGSITHNAVYVRRDGYVYYSGDFVDIKNNGVRPAIWINLESC